MKVFRTKKSLNSFLQAKRRQNLSIGFVPTMGALHEGHLSLVSASIQDNADTVVSIFVNPTQFNNPDDLKKYPRTLDQDLLLLEEISNDIIVFAPEAAAFYQGNVKAKSFDFGSIADQMEGRYRKGHFDGVGTIVSMLFEAVQPTRAYFGEKDFQQLQIIKKLVEISHFSIQIIGCPISREESGLARSSRNERLTSNQRKEASFIYQTLMQTRNSFEHKSANELRHWVKRQFENHPTLTLEYFEIAHEDTLLPVYRKRKNNSYRAFIAVQCGTVRLIDNIRLKH